jgi:hypothetical protein
MVISHGQTLEQGGSLSLLLLSPSSIFSSFIYFRVRVTFKDSKGNLIKMVEANEGDDILSIAHEHDIDLEGEKSFPLSFFHIYSIDLCRCL